MSKFVFVGGFNTVNATDSSNRRQRKGGDPGRVTTSASVGVGTTQDGRSRLAMNATRSDNGPAAIPCHGHEQTHADPQLLKKYKSACAPNSELPE